MALKFCRFWRLLHGIKNESDFYVVPRSISFPKGSVGFKTSVGTFIKEIQETRDGNVRVIEGINLPSPREPYMLKTAAENGSCPVCRTGLDIKHTDVLILSQFVRPDGCMLPRRVTGLCKKQQKRISKMVAMAQKAGLMSNLTPANSKKDPKLRYRWKKCNSYYDESTIKSW